VNEEKLSLEDEIESIKYVDIMNDSGCCAAIVDELL